MQGDALSLSVPVYNKDETRTRNDCPIAAQPGRTLFSISAANPEVSARRLGKAAD